MHTKNRTRELEVHFDTLLQLYRVHVYAMRNIQAAVEVFDTTSDAELQSAAIQEIRRCIQSVCHEVTVIIHEGDAAMRDLTGQTLRESAEIILDKLNRKKKNNRK